MLEQPPPEPRALHVARTTVDHCGDNVTGPEITPVLQTLESHTAVLPAEMTASIDEAVGVNVHGLSADVLTARSSLTGSCARWPAATDGTIRTWSTSQPLALVGRDTVVLDPSSVGCSLCCGSLDALGDADGAALDVVVGLAFGSEEPPEGQTWTASHTTRIRAARRSSRRRQYTAAGCGLPLTTPRYRATESCEDRRAMLTTTEVHAFHDDVLAWFDENARDLPWRRDTSGWSVLVSELMLQQTPVVRVLPVFEAWMARWPTPAALAAEPVGEAVRAWGRLGYPRRAQRLHAAAVEIVAEHGGEVPSDHAALLALPGVGEYTAAAVASFAFGGRHAVMDTNVRRVFARVVEGRQFPSTSVTAAERRLAESLLPAEDAHRWAAATMELGAVVCTAQSPRCDACPVRRLCRWRALGYPEHDGPPRRGQAWAGTDRMVRGRLMAVLREATEPVDKSALDAAWDDASQRERCLDSLLDDGLVTLHPDGRFSL